MKLLPSRLILVIAGMFIGCAPPGSPDDVLAVSEAAIEHTFTGSLSAGGKSWKSHEVVVDSASALEATLQWSKSSADLNLFVTDAAGTNLAGTSGSTARPEIIKVQVPAGTYRLGVKAVSGSASYSLTVSVTADTDPACFPAFPGDPRCDQKMYYGASVEGGDPTTFEASIGKKLSVFRSYMSETSSASKFASRATADLQNGRIPLISTKLPGTWASVAAGDHDAWLLERIGALAAVSGPVFLVLHHEPSGDGPPEDWIKMQQRARTLIDQNSSNITLVGILNGWEFLKNDPHPEVWNHPVGTGVHVMGFDSYNPWSPTNGKAWRSADVVFSPGVTIQSWGYPTLVGEYGCRTDPENPGRAAQWMRDAWDFAYANGFVGISYFNSGLNSPDGTWELDSERTPVFSDLLGRTQTARP